MIPKEQLQAWCNDYFKQPVVLDALSGDASLRRYFRIDHNKATYIVADAPPASEKNPEFVSIANQLEAADILAPQVLAHDFENGFLLLSDLGDQTLLPLLNEKTVDGYYTQSMHLMSELQMLGTTNIDSYDAELLLKEMQLFPEWFVGELLAYDLLEDERTLLNQSFQLLINSALEQPQVFVHRDYHSRNLMVTAEGELAVIDFQDAVKGPITYDLVSILRDCYVEWPQHLVSTWVSDYYLLANQQNLLEESITLAQFQQWFDWIGLQRHIKVLGIFARLALRDNKEDYLLDLPLVLKYTCRVLSMYPEQPELKTLLEWFETRLLPLALKQSWIKGRT